MTGINEDQQQICDDLIAFARAQLCDAADDRDQRGGLGAAEFRKLWARAAGSKILGLNQPRAFGGAEKDAIVLARSLEAFGYGCTDAGLCLGLSGQILAVQMPILEFGSDAQRAQYLPDLISGDRIGSICLTEPEAGSDVFAMQTTATEEDDHYVISGTKHFVGNAPIADLGLIFAKTAPERGSWGISGFLADMDDPAIRVEAMAEKMGLRSLPMGTVHLDGLRVPKSALLGRPGAGAAIIRRTMEWERGLIFAPCVGAMRRQLEEAVAFSKSRVQFGQPVSEFQSVSNRLADMRLRLETSRLLLLEAARVLASGETASLIASMAKLHLSEAYFASAQDALRVFGGIGYLKGQEVERSLRDAAGGIIYSGTSDIQRGIISDLL